MSTYPLAKSQPHFHDNHSLRCLICDHAFSLGEFQSIEMELSLDSNEEKQIIIQHLEDASITSSAEFSMNFLHKSKINSLNTINVCRSCYETANQK
jgi:hypothetical protein